jgi:3D (Asp-Asp-Asp) domain-containing protein
MGKKREGTTNKKVEYAIENICYVSVTKRLAIATAYTAGRESTGRERGHSLYGITASGVKVQAWHTIAMDKHVPFGTQVYIPYFRHKTNNGVFVVEDRGGAIKLSRKPVGIHKIDVYMPTRDAAIQFGRKVIPIYIVSNRRHTTMSVPAFPDNFELQQGVPIAEADVNDMIQAIANSAECDSVHRGDTTVIKIGNTFYVAKDGRFYKSELIDEAWL